MLSYFRLWDEHRWHDDLGKTGHAGREGPQDEEKVKKINNKIILISYYYLLNIFGGCSLCLFQFTLQTWASGGRKEKRSPICAVGRSYCGLVAGGISCLFQPETMPKTQAHLLSLPSHFLHSWCWHWMSWWLSPAVGGDASLVCGSLSRQREERSHHVGAVRHRDPERDRHQQPSAPPQTAPGHPGDGLTHQPLCTTHFQNGNLKKYNQHNSNSTTIYLYYRQLNIVIKRHSKCTVYRNWKEILQTKTY